MAQRPVDDDPVVCEIPVHLAENLRGQIYLVQFPLRPAYRPMPMPPRQARIKPENQILQLDYEVDQRGEHYDRDAEDYLKQKYQRLQSSTVPALTNYAVGAFRQGQLHLTPVKAMMQMRPSLAHIDAAVDEEEEDMEVEEAAQAAAPEIKEVQFQFKKKQSERAINAIQNSYAYKKQQINAEHWRELKVMDQNGIDDEFENLFSEREDEVVSAMSAEEYLKALRYRSKKDEPAPPINPAQTNVDMEEKAESDPSSAVHARTNIDPKHLPVYQVLTTDHVLHFDALATLLPSISEENLADALESIAVSLKGALLTKSSLVSSGDAAADARDKILRELRSHPSGVKRMDLVEKHSLDAEATKKTLEDIAELDPVKRVWRLRAGPDKSFARRFPSLAKAIEL